MKYMPEHKPMQKAGSNCKCSDRIKPIKPIKLERIFQPLHFQRAFWSKSWL